MSWYTTSQQKKKTFIVKIKPDKLPNTPEKEETFSFPTEEQARAYARHMYPKGTILSVKESNKFRVKFSPDFSSKDTFEDVVADTPEQAQEIIKRKFKNAVFEGLPRNLGIETPTSDYLPDGRRKDQSRGDFLGGRHQENKETMPWERDVPLRKRI